MEAAELRAGDKDQRSNKSVHLFKTFAVERDEREQHILREKKTGETMHPRFRTVNREGRCFELFFRRRAAVGLLYQFRTLIFQISERIFDSSPQWPRRVRCVV
jgi:hypothetical protein